MWGAGGVGRCGLRGGAAGAGHRLKSPYLTCAHELSITPRLSTEAGESGKLAPHYYSNCRCQAINLWGEERATLGRGAVGLNLTSLRCSGAFVPTSPTLAAVLPANRSCNL
ncbi:hypothetical protein E2C01_058343 [Portunus trituberculatus]|uniref:Uncharacterized protein n=1 Tax=Portunus trituberculatus TaxID=210409 RepID=A0A5B7GZL6_PORTR|nr:hypothetical protein [Portunus trituberculatus]